MNRRCHLLVAIHDRSWGRAEIAVRVASDLRAAGDDVRFLIHESVVPLLQGTGFEYELVKDHICGLVRLLIDNCVRRWRPASVIYFDFFNTANYLYRLGVSDSSFLLSYDCATITLDTWDYRLTGHCIDLFGDNNGNLVLGDLRKKLEEFGHIRHRLIPVPVAPFEDAEGKFACLSRFSRTHGRKRWRSQLGIPASHRIMLLCTSKWQQPEEHQAEGLRITNLLPCLVAEYIQQLGSSVHLVHVGPKPYDLQHILDNRYHWQHPLGRRDFEGLIASVDLLISANISATSVTSAIQLNVPIVVLRNSQTISTIEDALSAAEGRLSQSIRAHLPTAFPIYPFLHWPLGYYRFLQPLLANNPYCEAFDTLELLHESAVVERCHKLLFDTSAGEEMAERQRRYTHRVCSLPSASQVVGSFFN